MKNAITHTAGNNSREISSHGTAHSEFKNFLANFWNLVDFPHHKLEETEPKILVDLFNNYVEENSCPAEKYY